MYMDETGHISNKPHCSYYNGEIRVEKGKGKWIIIYVHIGVATCLNETKKGGETSKSKILRILKRGI